jgi:hypothetical protein
MAPTLLRQTRPMVPHASRPKSSHAKPRTVTSSRTRGMLDPGTRGGKTCLRLSYSPAILRTTGHAPLWIAEPTLINLENSKEHMWLPECIHRKSPI